MNKYKKRAGPTPCGYVQRTYVKGVGLSLVWVKCYPFNTKWAPIIIPNHASNPGIRRTGSFRNRFYFYLYNGWLQNRGKDDGVTRHYYVVLSAAESAMGGFLVGWAVVFICFFFGLVPATGILLIASTVGDDLQRMQSNAVSMKRTVAIFLVAGWIVRFTLSIHYLHTVWRV